MKDIEPIELAKQELKDNRYRCNLMEECLEISNRDPEQAENLYIQKRIFEIKQEGHLSGEKELRPMLMPLLILYSLGILLVAFLVYIFVKP
jgi:hypothetical protein